MSYSFSVQANTTDEVERQVSAKLDEVLANQPSHKVDLTAALAATQSFVRLLREPKPTEDLYASVSGSVWVGDGSEVNSASVNVSVGFKPK